MILWVSYSKTQRIYTEERIITVEYSLDTKTLASPRLTLAIRYPCCPTVGVSGGVGTGSAESLKMTGVGEGPPLCPHMPR